ncbi:hypothetical protein [Aestuariivirga sp.]|uniref:hypothetical protein n=1 Tax=Aestuariivirga sp. TaxID=2650926 RepID=UPI0039E6C953
MNITSDTIVGIPVSGQSLTSHAEFVELATRLGDTLPMIELPKPFKVGLVIKVSHQENSPAATFIRIGDPTGKCNVTGKPMPWWGRKWYISPNMTDGEIVQTVFKALLTAVEHETREQFLFKGVAIFDPHIDLDKLVQLHAQPGAFKTRAEAAVSEYAKHYGQEG